MTNHRIFHTTFAACVLLAATGFAQAEIVQCVTVSGAMTFTDSPCKIHSQTVQVLDSGEAALTSARLQSATSGFAAAERARVAAWKVKRPPARRMSSDVAMLKIAKANMISQDLETALVRRQAAIDAAQSKSPSFLLWLVSSSASAN